MNSLLFWVGAFWFFVSAAALFGLRARINELRRQAEGVVRLARRDINDLENRIDELEDEADAATNRAGEIEDRLDKIEDVVIEDASEEESIVTITSSLDPYDISLISVLYTMGVDIAAANDDQFDAFAYAVQPTVPVNTPQFVVWEPVSGKGYSYFTDGRHCINQEEQGS